MIDLGAGLKAIREAHGFTMREVSARSGVNLAQISRLETGVLTNPTLRVMRQLTALYHLDPAWWFNEEAP